MSAAMDRLWDTLLNLKRKLGPCELGETRVSVRAEDLETVLRIADGHQLFCERGVKLAHRERRPFVIEGDA